MNILYHPSQVDAETQRVQQLQNQSVAPQEQVQTEAPIAPTQFSRSPNPEGQASNQQPTDSLIQALSQPAQIDPRLQASLDRFAPSPEPNGVPVPKGFKQRLLFGLANAIQTMGARASQLPAYSREPIDDPVSTLISGIASGVGSAVNPNQALKERYINQVLPAYYQREALKGQMRKEILNEAKLQGEVGAQSTTELKKRLDSILVGRNIQAKGIENDFLAPNLQNRNRTGAANATIAEANAGNINTVNMNKDQLAALQIKQAASNLDLSQQTSPFKVASAKSAAQIAVENAATNAAYRQSLINRNNRVGDNKGNLTNPQKAKVDADDAWRAEEPKQYAKFAEAEKAKLAKMKGTVDPADFKEMEANFETHTKKLWDKQKEKIRKDFVQKEYDSNMRKNGGYRPSKSAEHAALINKALE